MKWLSKITKPNPPEAVKYLALIDKLRWIAFLSGMAFGGTQLIPWIRHQKVLSFILLWTLESILAAVCIGAVYALIRYLIAYFKDSQ
ncbi:hypothetical protein Aaci_2882 [Alicyclobacillus acidocaldarius subsp. acidocaldarius DSM 446]|uniref:Uncharacterized protein n=1 Tax=Alicyclobacillus acidocaldarius subsp. acidocaldarius (strain ATCC 27009 / DSM 446 / BCRC 14685 / JCM 5260 / KCTC 1825 / NBRC 15652 / NCIMB 11725 / NRRL B-14509 / 104-IA) TaxID=521098 RepID=C8WUS0_ALIAD|nr:hypothetical protein Aaci_2882 [Alicyclobacillus acidocaldarius subsp. acidocaldarius DSM 446]